MSASSRGAGRPTLPERLGSSAEEQPAVQIELLLSNILSPPVLFFALGMLATAVRSDLSVPDSIQKLFSLYLLWAIGFKGGYELRHAGLELDVAVPIMAAIAISFLTPVFVFPIFCRMFKPADACAIAACFGSVSVVTFITAQNFLALQGVPIGGYMVAALALMEAPAIVVAVVLYRAHSHKLARARGDATSGAGILPLIREAATGAPVFLLLGSLIAGVLAGEPGWNTLRPFCEDIFHGVLVLFLLEAGMTASRQLREIGDVKAKAVATGLIMPLIGASVAVAIGRLLGLSVGDATILAVLSASASYIAVPAAMRIAVPEANSGLYLPMSLGITFPFNIAIGIPLYLGAVRLLWPEAIG
ncbi:MAG: sodium-dependent bicarbonate transport family permease [Planctomycetota bacterium]